MKTETFGDYVLQQNEDGSTTGFAKLSPIFTCDSMLPETNWQFAVIIVSTLNIAGITPETFKSARKINLPPLELAYPIAAINSHFANQAAENDRKERVNEVLGVTLPLDVIHFLAMAQISENKFRVLDILDSTHAIWLNTELGDDDDGFLYGGLNEQYDTNANRYAIKSRRIELGLEG